MTLNELMTKILKSSLVDWSNSENHGPILLKTHGHRRISSTYSILGSLVHRETYVGVDGGHCILPLPKSDDSTDRCIGMNEAKLIKLSVSLTVNSDWNAAMERAQIEVRVVRTWTTGPALYSV
jgi:hypothetical protein